ncbi:hypothetical protein BN8_00510 [Fibrisoma limi BUZ 3]|uniref:HD domain-containing protein n=1 Tax=Fibrisoma limi BUZ 3 TaxID=1185876 RepID=I2GCF7_9BACT|nr:AAA family ATPase [Fibrisoma limi]CCH51581.1 hypothetical protein BN8_00510 [Fibrisoma limi BUZ 3]
MSWQLSTQTDWSALEDQFDWVRAMRGVPQDALYHAEGDVAAHTQMVLEALTSQQAYQSLPRQRQAVVWAAALLHDVEKRSTTVREPDGRITSRGHAKRGERTARSLLYIDHPTPFLLREAVAQLVRHHGLPLWLWDKADPHQRMLGVSQLLDTSELTMLARADVLGRVCADQAELAYRVDLFADYAQEQGCWGRPYPFPDPFTRYAYFNQPERSPDYAAFDATQTQVALLCGLPGSGKDYYAGRHYADWPVVSLDALRRKAGINAQDRSGTGRVVQQAKELARQYLRRQQPFVWNATNVTRTIRQQLIDLFVTYRAKVRLVYVEVPYTQLMEQNRNRKYVVPEPVISQLLTKLEIPVPWEAHEVIYAVSG